MLNISLGISTLLYIMDGTRPFRKITQKPFAGFARRRSKEMPMPNMSLGNATITGTMFR